jgi:hypothetical protein
LAIGNGSSLHKILLKWSIIKLLAPLQSLISKSNSCNKIIQRISLGYLSMTNTIAKSFFLVVE